MSKSCRERFKLWWVYLLEHRFTSRLQRYLRNRATKCKVYSSITRTINNKTSLCTAPYGKERVCNIINCFCKPVMGPRFLEFLQRHLIAPGMPISTVIVVDRICSSHLISSQSAIWLTRGFRVCLLYLHTQKSCRNSIMLMAYTAATVDHCNHGH